MIRNNHYLERYQGYNDIIYQVVTSRKERSFV